MPWQPVSSVPLQPLAAQAGAAEEPSQNPKSRSGCVQLRQLLQRTRTEERAYVGQAPVRGHLPQAKVEALAQV